MFDLILLDGKNLAFIAQFQKLILSPDNQQVQCAQNFITAVRNLAAAYESAELTVLWDGSKNWRKDLLDAYKANRVVDAKNLEARAEIDRQMPVLKKLCQAAGVHQVYNDAAEADDLAAYYAKMAVRNNVNVLLVSRDSDWLQLVNPNVTVYNPVSKDYSTHDDFFKDNGLQNVNQFIEAKALAGDSADNIPPVGGIGKVTAKKLLLEHGCVADFITSNDLGDKPRKAVVDFHADKAKHQGFYRNRMLIDLLNNPNFDSDLNEFTVGKYNENELFELLAEIEFASVMNNFETWRHCLKMKTKAEITKELAEAGIETAPATKENKLWLDTGFPAFNKKLSGAYDRGYQQGLLHGIKGGSQTGKTIAASMAMRSAQQTGGIAALVDYERAFQIDLCEKFGVDTEQPNFFINRPDTFEDGENWLRKLGKTLRLNAGIEDTAPILIVVDSLAAAIPATKLEKAEKGEALNMKDNLALAQATSNSFPLTASLAEKYNFTVLYLNQLRESPSLYKGNYAPGGKSWEFYLSTITCLRRENTVEGKGVNKDFKVQDISMETEKTRNTKPFQTAMWRLRFDDDNVCYFDTETSMVMHMSDEGKVIERKGSWFEYGKHRAQGMEKFVELVKAEGLLPEMIDKLINGDEK